MNDRRRLILLFAVSGWLAVPGTTPGQVDDYVSGFYTRGADLALYMDQAGSTLDPFYIPVQAWSVLPRVTLAATHDDNVFLSPDEAEAATTIDLIPGMLVIYGRPDRNHLSVDAGLILPVYDDATDLNQDPSYLLTLGGAYKTAKSQITGRLGFRRIENVDTLIGARIVKQDVVGDVALEHRISGKTSLGVLGRAEFHRFDEDVYVDYDRIYGAGRMIWRASAKNDVFVQAGVGRDDLDQTRGNRGDADFFDVSLGLRGKPSPKSSLSGRVGYMWRTHDDEDLDDVNHWIAAIGGETTPFGLTTFTADLTGDIRPAVNAEGSSSVDQRLTLGVNRRLWVERFRGNASIFFGRVDYYGEDGRPESFREDQDLIFDGREDDYWGYSVGLDWWARQNFSVGLSYAYFENRGSRSGSSEEQDRTSYSSGRWVLRMSWNY